MPDYGCFSRVFRVLDELDSKPLAFWRELLEKTFIDQVAVEVLCMPSKAMADALAASDQAEIDQRVDLFGTHGLNKLGEKARQAVKDNAINLSKEVLVDNCGNCRIQCRLSQTIR